MCGFEVQRVEVPPFPPFGCGGVGLRVLPVSGPVAMAPPLSSASAFSSSIFVAQVLAKSKSGRPDGRTGISMLTNTRSHT